LPLPPAVVGAVPDNTDNDQESTTISFLFNFSHDHTTRRRTKNKKKANNNEERRRSTLILHGVTTPLVALALAASSR
jgi:hypothetical protein